MQAMDNKDTKQQTRRVLIAQVTATQLFPIPEKAEDEKQHSADEDPAESGKEKE